MNLLAKIGLFGLLAGGTAGVLYADPAGGWLSPNSPQGVPGSTGAPGPSPAGAAVTVTMSQADMQVRIVALREQSRSDTRHIHHLQAIARKEKDVIKLNCVNDKLVQAKPQMNIADMAASELTTAPEADRMAIFESLSQAAESVRLLREEADQCIGQPIQTGGDSSNTFTGPEAPDDPTKGMSPPELEPPSYASPFN